MPSEIISSTAENYAALYTSPEDSVLRTINKETAMNHPQSHMLSGHVQGRFLAFLSKLIQPKFVLEIGTFTGYSALCLAEGIAEGGELHTIELRQEDADTALKNFKAAQKNNIITLHVGDAKEIIPTLKYQWDLVFIDADKVNYIEYYELVLKQLSKKVLSLQITYYFTGRYLKSPLKEKMLWQ